MMREGVVYLVVLAAFLASSPAMSRSAGMPSGNCHVAEGGKLSPDVSVAMICNAVEKAITAEAPGVRFSAEIRVVSPSRLTATLIVEGRTLPVQNFAVMDRNLSKRAVRQFAASLASIVKAERA